MTSVCKMNWISSSDEAINLFDYNYWHFKWVWKVWVQMAILLKFLIMQLCWKESCCIKVSNWTMIHIFYIHLNSYTYSTSLLLTGSSNQFPNYEFWIFTNFSTNEKKIYMLVLVFICWNLDPVTKIVFKLPNQIIMVSHILGEDLKDKEGEPSKMELNGPRRKSMVGERFTERIDNKVIMALLLWYFWSG